MAPGWLFRKSASRHVARPLLSFGLSDWLEAPALKALYPTSIRLVASRMLSQTAPHAARAFIDFVNASPTPFHAVAVAAGRLEKSGFRRVRSLSQL